MHLRRESFWSVFAAAALAASTVLGQTTPTSEPPTAGPSVEQEVLANIVQQPVGACTLDAYRLSADLLSRLTDQILRSTYQQQYHQVVADGEQRDTTDPLDPTVEQSPTTDGPLPIRIHTIDSTEKVERYRRALPEARPGLRGFRAPILNDASERRPIEPPDGVENGTLRLAADQVCRRLASDGLLATTVLAVDLIGPASLAGDEDRAIEALRASGLPVDLLRHFEIGGQRGDARAALRHIVARLSAGQNPESVRNDLDDAAFRWIPSAHGYRVVTESGEDEVAGFRMQLTRGTLWGGVGAGGCLDVARQLIEQVPDAWFTFSIEQRHVAEFLRTAATWDIRNPSRLTVIPSPQVVSQWAQDNGKVGRVATASGAVAVTLAPRYASRRSDGSIFIPNESFVMDGFAATGHRVVQSSLLFQGGNVMAVRHPVTGRRILLVGEAEIERNTSMGLSRAQATEAFRAEFGVDQVETLPAISFHIDFELNVRAADHRLIAFVNDSPSAVRIVLDVGLDALERHGLLDANEKKRVQQLLKDDRRIEFINAVSKALRARELARGQYPLSLAEAFSTGPADSGVGNFQRFLMAIDLLAAWSVEPGRMSFDRHAEAYVRSFHRRDADRLALFRKLIDLGFSVAGVPSLSEEERSLNYINGIHTRSRFLMPAYGGLYAPLDRAAAAVYRRELGPGVEIVPILCAESQRRGGAIHCAASAYPQ